MDFKVFIVLLGVFDLRGGAGAGSEVPELTKDNFKQNIMAKSHFVMFYSKR